MRNFTRIAGSFLLVVTICAAVMLIRTRPAAVATQPQQQKDERTNERREKLRRLRTQEFRGEAATLRAKQLRRLHKGVARAMKDAERLGLRQAFQHGRVILATDPDADGTAAVIKPGFGPKQNGQGRALSFASLPSQNFSDGDYEVMFIPYDDGDPNTWEGIIYRYTPDYGEDIRYAVIDIQTDQPEVTQEVVYPSDGGDPQPPGSDPPIMSSNPSGGSQSQRCLAASAVSPRFRNVKLTEWAGMRPPCPAGWKPCLRLRDECCSPPPNLGPWLRCTTRTCGMAALGCSRVGPIASECWGGLCTGAMLLCML